MSRSNQIELHVPGNGKEKHRVHNYVKPRLHKLQIVNFEIVNVVTVWNA
jgi:hypothetical protein